MMLADCKAQHVQGLVKTSFGTVLVDCPLSFNALEQIPPKTVN